MAERCELCRFWAQLKAHGVCRRLPPVPDIGPAGWSGSVPREADRAYGIWPATDQDDWCGEFRAKPELCLHGLQEIDCTECFPTI